MSRYIFSLFFFAIFKRAFACVHFLETNSDIVLTFNVTNNVNFCDSLPDISITAIGSSFGFAGDSIPKKGGQKGGKKGLEVNQKMDQSASLMVPLNLIFPN